MAGDLIELAQQSRGRAIPGVRSTRLRIAAEVVAYFGDVDANLYQLRQWLPALESLHASHPVVVLTRQADSYQALSTETALPLLLVRDLTALEDVYAANDFKVVLYVNNGAANFTSLTFTDVLHVHLNHGESDKVCMASNQAKAYDRVFVAGDAAVERYRANLINFDGAGLVKIGRPQLDVTYPAYRPASQRPTVLYAPTWEGGRPEMDYSSLAVYGEALVRAVLASELRLIYRPHPKTGLGSAEIAEADRRVRALVAAAAQQAPRTGHVVDTDTPMGGLFGATNVLVSDVSSVALDFLATTKPLVVCDIRNDRAALLDASPVSRVAHVLDQESLPAAVDDLRRLLREDSGREERVAAIEHYFGDVTPGVATKSFVEAIAATIAVRDRLVAEKRRRNDQ